ncbi:MAG TPA: Gfo/Idh/MocA family oxidoreductase [Phnomibacter sp.]|nr:Gfo/Idh/MocA family oxidoreductase [Phnomibacter sp.]
MNKNPIIQWGIIGCGDVTEKKSGPAFNKVPNSRLVAVMRRDAAKAEDYARRHGVPYWYHNAGHLVSDPEVNAVYVATPPDTHEHYVRLALESGKPVYVEKPMALNHASALRMHALSRQYDNRLVVAHYRREWPFFQHVKELLDDGTIGEPLTISLQFYRERLSDEELKRPGMQWRLDPGISGGGLFHDLAPHQLDLLIWMFGEVAEASGRSVNLGKQYAAPDTVAGFIQFRSGVQFTGQWCFCAPPGESRDIIEVVGTEGRMHFPIFSEQYLLLENKYGARKFSYDDHEHVQLHMIDAVVRFFRGEGDNPCSAAEGAMTMRVMDAFSR